MFLIEQKYVFINPFEKTSGTYFIFTVLGNKVKKITVYVHKYKNYRCPFFLQRNVVAIIIAMEESLVVSSTLLKCTVNYNELLSFADTKRLFLLRI